MQFYVDPDDTERAKRAFENNRELTLVALTDLLRRSNPDIPHNVVAYLWRQNKTS